MRLPVCVYALGLIPNVLGGKEMFCIRVAMFDVIDAVCSHVVYKPECMIDSVCFDHVHRPVCAIDTVCCDSVYKLVCVTGTVCCLQFALFVLNCPTRDK